ncbi:hypothetical protein H0H92_014668 [Tricholoma furcatifolium]|nr:hypothetical protein H0H92_014668 [Tricholoma furcatifolium]
MPSSPSIPAPSPAPPVTLFVRMVQRDVNGVIKVAAQEILFRVADVSFEKAEGDDRAAYASDMREPTS